MLARDDVDAVSMAPGERWHALMCMEAARRGKHVYCEKPLALSIAEAKAARDTVQRCGVAFQLGTQQRSSQLFRFAAELALNGRIGQLQTIAIGSAGGGRTALPLGLGFTQMPAEKPAPIPPGVDWDMWLGPLPWAPYSDLRITRTWMSMRDYGLGGIGGEYGVHDIDFGQWANDSDNTTPISVEGTGDFYHDIRDTLTTYEIEYKYANGVKTWRSLWASRGRLSWLPPEQSTSPCESSCPAAIPIRCSAISKCSPTGTKPGPMAPSFN